MARHLVEKGKGLLREKRRKAKPPLYQTNIETKECAAGA
jgi:hypothetical protein